MTSLNDFSSDHEQPSASQVRAARARCAYSVEAVAELAGVDLSVIVAIEEGKSSGSDTLPRERVFELLGLRVFSAPLTRFVVPPGLL